MKIRYLRYIAIAALLTSLLIGTGAFAASVKNTRQTSAANVRWKSAEKLLRSDWLYNYALVINYNTAAPVPWKGSAIFLHEWRSQYSGTTGCIAVSESNLLQIIK